MSCADETVQLAPALDRFQLGAISLPNEIDRVVAFQEDTTQAIELARIQAGTREHLATMAYRLDNAIFAHGNLYFKGGHSVLRPKTAKPLLPRKFNHFAEVQICTNPSMTRYFGHWIRDGLLLELLASQRGLTALTDVTKPWPHEMGYRELVGLKAIKTEHARIDRLWVIDDRGVNAFWVERFQELRRRVRAGTKSNGPKRVMLTRGKLGVSRNLVNNEVLKNH